MHMSMLLLLLNILNIFFARILPSAAQCRLNKALGCIENIDRLIASRNINHQELPPITKWLGPSKRLSNIVRYWGLVQINQTD